MSQSSIFARARRRWLIALAFVGIAGCSTTEFYELGQPIEMGPWAFEVERAWEQVQTKGAGLRIKTITVTIRLHNYKERHEEPFDTFMMRPGSGIGGMFMKPIFRLVDKEGTGFEAILTPRSGGSLRSERWQAVFELVPLDMRSALSADAADLAARHLDTRLSELAVEIDNPDRRSGQPRRVVVPLQ